ncbi:hypothetical protein JCM1840_000846 [Sporobolomyces johnsonii]
MLAGYFWAIWAGLKGQYGTLGFYSAVQRCFIAFGLLGSPASFVIDAPFGRFVNSSWTVNGSLGWLLMELVSPLSFLYFLSLPPSPSPSSFLVPSPTRILDTLRTLPRARTFLVALFLIHYCNRSIVSTVRNPSRARMNIAVPFSAALFNLANGCLIGMWIGGGAAGASGAVAQNLGLRNDGSAKVLFSAGAVLWLAGFLSNIYHDEVLYALKRSKMRSAAARPKTAGSPSLKDRYAIPTAGLYRFVSHPSYTSEWFEWLGFLLCTLALAPAPFPPPARSTSSLTRLLSFFRPSRPSLVSIPNPLVPLQQWYAQPPALFLWQEVAVMLPRARSGHRWYKRTFGQEWENKGARWAVLPGVY